MAKDAESYSAEVDGQPESHRPADGREPEGSPITRRRLLAAAGVGAVAGVGYLVGRASVEGGAGAGGGPAPESAIRTSLDDFAENVTRGGPPKDGIPPIDEPRFVSAREADFLKDEDVVFGLVRGGEARAYPQLVLVWHEIVNDRWRDGPLSVTYCPLTGSAVAFSGERRGGKATTFGTSGKLVNSNLVMYDRATDSWWPQILARAIAGTRRGARLREVPVDWTTWGRWRAAHPGTRVLSTETGYLRSYGDDPYGTYTPLGGYYAEPNLLFPAMHRDHRFDAKEVFIGAKLGDDQAAARKSTLSERGAMTTRIDGKPVAFLHDPGLDEGRAFLARARGREIELTTGDDDGVYEGAGSRWDAFGKAVSGPLAGARLERVLSYDVMWFAWFGFFPRTKVLA